MNFSDAHIHIGHVVDGAALIKAYGPGYKAMVPALDAQDACENLRLFGGIPGVRVGVALHPWRVGDTAHASARDTWTPGDPLEQLERVDERMRDVRALSTSADVNAIGETGLDAYRYRRGSYADARVLATFIWHARIARDVGKPLLIHCVRDHARCIDVLDQIFGASPRRCIGMVHGFSGSIEEMDAYVRRGVMIGIGPLVTQPRARRVREAAAQVPEALILTETDAPYMRVARDTPGSPHDIEPVLRTVATLRGVSVEEVGSWAEANLTRLFDLAGTPTPLS